MENAEKGNDMRKILKSILFFSVVMFIVVVEIYGMVKFSDLMVLSHKHDLIEAFYIMGFCFLLCIEAAFIIFTIILLVKLFYPKDWNYFIKIC